MKYITFLLTVYMTLLAVMPCRDNDVTAESVKLYSSHQKGHSAHQEEGKDSCTPFCACACCSIARTLAPIHDIPAVFIPEISSSFGQHQVSALPDCSQSMWQPPQLV